MVVLKKELRGLEIVALGAGAMIGSLWIYMGGDWTSKSGTGGAALAYLFAGGMCVLLGLLYAELTSAMPKAGGPVGWTLRALGPRWGFATFWGLIPLYAICAAIYPVLLVFVLKLTGLLPQEGWMYIRTFGGMPIYASDILIGMAFMALFATIAYRGVKIAGQVQKITFIILAAVGVWCFVSGLAFGNIENAKPMFTGAGGIIWTMLMAPGFMVGFDLIPQMSEEAKIPPRRIGMLVVAAILVAMLFYIIVCIASGWSADATIRAQSYTGLVVGIPAIYGTHWVLYILLTGALMGIVTTWNAFMSGGARMMYGASRGGLLPPFLNHLNKYGVPDRPLWIFIAIAIIASFFGMGMFMMILRGGGLFLVVAWLISAIAFIQLRRKEPEMNRPYKVKFGIPLGVGALVVCGAWLAIYFPPIPGSLVWPQEWIFPIILAAAGVGLYSWQSVKSKGIPQEERLKAMLGDYAK